MGLRTVVAVALFIVPLSRASGGSISDVSFHGFGGPDKPLADDEARTGLTRILAGSDAFSGVPVPLYRKISEMERSTDESRFLLFGSFPAPPWLNDESRGAGVPLDLSVTTEGPQRVKVVGPNCFTCHAGVVAGQVVAGLGNTHHDGGGINAGIRKLLRQAESPLGAIQLSFLLQGPERKVMDGHLEFLRTFLLPSTGGERTRGDIHAPFGVWRYVARMADPANGFVMGPPGVNPELEALLDRPYPPSDPNPWWHLKYKKRAFWAYDAKISSVASFALNLMAPRTVSTEEFKARMETARLQLAFAAQTTPPRYPGPLDAQRAERGWRLFHGQETLADGSKLPCTQCHGTYGQDGKLESYPERGRIPLSIINTDPEMASLLHGSMKPLYDHFFQSPLVEHGKDGADYPDTEGYVPPPLVGVWASAPYFHNGSVPTVTQVLSSSSRPALWKKSVDPFAYDWVRLGLTYEDVTQPQYEALVKRGTEEGDSFGPKSQEMRRVYSTNEYGRKNSGHTFGDRMSDEERACVVEFLKSL